MHFNVLLRFKRIPLLHWNVIAKTCVREMVVGCAFQWCYLYTVPGAVAILVVFQKQVSQMASPGWKILHWGFYTFRPDGLLSFDKLYTARRNTIPRFFSSYLVSNDTCCILVCSS